MRDTSNGLPISSLRRQRRKRSMHCTPPQRERPHAHPRREQIYWIGLVSGGALRSRRESALGRDRRRLSNLTALTAEEDEQAEPAKTPKRKWVARRTENQTVNRAEPQRTSRARNTAGCTLNRVGKKATDRVAANVSAISGVRRRW